MPKNKNESFKSAYFLGIMLSITFLSIITGFFDVILPILAGDQPFYHLSKFVGIFGYAYIFLHVFFHNLGLACVVPSIGLLSVYYEKKERFRPFIGHILTFTVLFALFSGFIYMELDLNKHTLILLIFEIEGVLILALGGYSVLQNIEIKETLNKTIQEPIQKIIPYFILSVITLAIGAFFEVMIIAGI